MRHGFSSSTTACLCVLTACLAIGLIAPWASSQPQQNAPEVLRPPPPPKEENPAVFVQYLVMVLIGAAAIGANLIPSKRGHQD
jgi:hypothetical protein